jgi:hypothetical protein
MGKNKNNSGNGKRPTKSYVELAGLGQWCTLHMMAIHCKTESEKDAVLYLIHLYANKFHCKKCEKHFREYTISHPPEQYRNKPNGLFYWTFKAHNNANKLTGKKQMSYEDALEEFEFARR